MKKKTFCLLLSLVLLISASLAVHALERNNDGDEVMQTYSNYNAVDKVTDVYYYDGFIPCSVFQEHSLMSLEDFEEALQLFMNEYYVRRPLEDFEKDLELFWLDQGAIAVDDNWLEREDVVFGDLLFYDYPEMYEELTAHRYSLENDLYQFIHEQRRLETEAFEKGYAQFLYDRFGVVVESSELYFCVFSSYRCGRCNRSLSVSTQVIYTGGPDASSCSSGHINRSIICSPCLWGTVLSSTSFRHLHSWTASSRSWIEHRAVHPGNCNTVTETWDRCTNRCSSTRNVRRQTSVFWCTNPGLFRQGEYEE